MDEKHDNFKKNGYWVNKTSVSNTKFCISQKLLPWEPNYNI